MRKSAAFLLLLICFSPFVDGQKTRYGQSLPKAKPGVDYPLKLHIYATHIRSDCQSRYLQKQVPMTPGPETSCIDVIVADININEKKIELTTDSGVNLDPFRPLTLPLGDYQARFTKKTPNMDPTAMGLKYDLLLPDKKVLRCTVTGVSE
jgi:hypothetical protein